MLIAQFDKDRKKANEEMSQKNNKMNENKSLNSIALFFFYYQITTFFIILPTLNK